MTDLIAGLGLVLVVEGLLWAAAPGLGRRMLEIVAVTPEQSLRAGGAIAIVLGVAVVWLARG